VKPTANRISAKIFPKKFGDIGTFVNMMKERNFHVQN
jgi:hypothetical protein